MYEAQIRTGGRVIKVKVEARSGADAKALLEGQHGRGCILTGPNKC